MLGHALAPVPISKSMQHRVSAGAEPEFYLKGASLIKRNLYTWMLFQFNKQLCFIFYLHLLSRHANTHNYLLCVFVFHITINWRPNDTITLFPRILYTYTRAIKEKVRGAMVTFGHHIARDGNKLCFAPAPPPPRSGRTFAFFHGDGVGMGGKI